MQKKKKKKVENKIEAETSGHTAVPDLPNFQPYSYYYPQKQHIKPGKIYLLLDNNQALQLGVPALLRLGSRSGISWTASGLTL